MGEKGGRRELSRPELWEVYVRPGEGRAWDEMQPLCVSAIGERPPPPPPAPPPPRFNVFRRRRDAAEPVEMSEKADKEMLQVATLIAMPVDKLGEEEEVPEVAFGVARVACSLGVYFKL